MITEYNKSAENFDVGNKKKEKIVFLKYFMTVKNKMENENNTGEFYSLLNNLHAFNAEFTGVPHHKRVETIKPWHRFISQIIFVFVLVQSTLERSFLGVVKINMGKNKVQGN